MRRAAGPALALLLAATGCGIPAGAPSTDPVADASESPGAGGDEREAGAGEGYLTVDTASTPVRLRVLGTGSPTVVFDSGLGDGLDSWDGLQQQVAELTRTVAWDRPGLGASPPSPEPRTAMRIAGELREALDNAGIEPPFLLVGHSRAGLHIRAFAHLDPEAVDGLVFVDPTTEEMFASFETPEGIERLEKSLAGYPAGVAAEGRATPESLREIRSIGAPPEVPLVVLTGTRPLPEALPSEMAAELEAAGMTLEDLARNQEKALAFHRRLARSVEGGAHVSVISAGHYVHKDDPQAVLKSIRWLLDRLRLAEPGDAPAPAP